MNLSQEFLQQSRDYCSYYRYLGEKALAQITDEQLFSLPATESNSIAIIVKHLAGNMKARWTDVFMSDGEKAHRNRDEEFITDDDTPETIRALWHEGWNIFFTALDSFQEEDLARIITIRQEPHTIMRAIMRQMTHYSYHVGQIVYLAKLHANESWISLSIPRGGSAQFVEKAPIMPHRSSH